MNINSQPVFEIADHVIGRLWIHDLLMPSCCHCFNCTISYRSLERMQWEYAEKASRQHALRTAILLPSKHGQNCCIVLLHWFPSVSILVSCSELKSKFALEIRAPIKFLVNGVVVGSLYEMQICILICAELFPLFQASQRSLEEIKLQHDYQIYLWGKWYWRY